MKKSIGKVTLNNSIAPESPRNGASGAERVMPYVAPRVKVVKFQVEHGFGSSLMGMANEEMNTTCWDRDPNPSVGTTEMETTTWDLF